MKPPTEERQRLALDWRAQGLPYQRVAAVIREDRPDLADEAYTAGQAYLDVQAMLEVHA